MSQEAGRLARGEEAGNRSSLGAENVPPLTVACRALLILFGTGFSTGLGLGVVLLRESIVPYLTANQMPPGIRWFVLGMAFGAAALLPLGSLFVLWLRRRQRAIVPSLLHVAHRFSPLCLTGFLPLLPRWTAWKDRPLTFLLLTALTAGCFELALRAAIAVGPLGWEAPVRRFLGRPFMALRARFPRATARLPLTLVCAGAAGYAAYFGYATVAWHWSVRSGYDLALQNNLMWNLVHGGPFMKSSPLTGPLGSHFGHDATLFAYVIAPLYALYQRAESLLVIQSLLLGFAAVPLFLFARLHTRPPIACLIAFAYLLYPAVHGANLFEFHYLPLSTFFLWSTAFALEAERPRLAAVCAVLTLSVHEDAAPTLAVLGAYFLASGRRPRPGLAVLAGSLVYFAAMKFVVMPAIAGGAGEDPTTMHQALLPVGTKTGFGALLTTIFGNPWYTTQTLLEENKLIYFLQMLVPLALLPLRRPLAILFLVPGVFFNLLSTGYAPALSIHYQHSTHFTGPLFLLTALVFASGDRVRRGAWVGALALATLASTHQFGAILQRSGLWGGPIAYEIGASPEGARRRRALDAVVSNLPPGAKVACSAFTTPQVSSRRDAYSLTLGLYDADYVLFPSEPADFVGPEKATVLDLLTRGTFGVVTVKSPFALARRGHASTDNAALAARIR